MNRFIRLLLLAAIAVPAVAAAQDPPPPAEPTAEPPKKKGVPLPVTYDGGTTFKTDDGKFELKLNAMAQFRLDWTKVQEGAANTRFILPRARVALAGALWKETQFKVEWAISDAGATRPRDVYINQLFLDGAVQVRVGTFKRNFNRQELVSDFATQFFEKALTNGLPGVQGSRDLGVMVHNGHDKSPDGLEWSLGLFNGAGDGATTSITCATDAMGATTCNAGTPTNTPSDWQPQIIARAGYNLGGIKGYSEADMEGGPFRLAVGANYRLRNLQDKPGAPLEHNVSADFVAKIEGFALDGAFFFRKIKDVDDSQIAFHAQAGYMFIPKKAGAALRFAMVPDSATPSADPEYVNEIRAAFTWYFSGNHNFKWLTEFGYQKGTADGAVATLQLRTGGQFVF